MNKEKYNIDPLYRDKILGKVIDYASRNHIQFSLKQMTSFDPKYDENYAQNFEDFIRENSMK